MELFNKSGVAVSSVLVLVGALIACQAQEDAIPSSSVIEAAAMQLGPQGQTAAERRLQEWAEQGSAVAQRELALRYLSNPAKRQEAMQLFERAASAGDAQATIERDGMYHANVSALQGVNPADSAGLNTRHVIKEAANVNYLPR